MFAGLLRPAFQTPAGFRRAFFVGRSPMSRRLLDRDPLSGLVEYHHYDAATGRSYIETVQDVAPILERNKALQNAGDRGWSASRELRRAATIPDIIILKWRSEEGIDVFDPNDWPAVKRKLNSSEYRWLRTAPGRI